MTSTKNGGATITASKIHDIVGFYNIGISTTSDQVTITNNQLYNDSRIGIYVSAGNNSTITGNTVYGDGVGIEADTSTVSAIDGRLAGVIRTRAIRRSSRYAMASTRVK